MPETKDRTYDRVKLSIAEMAAQETIAIDTTANVVSSKFKLDGTTDVDGDNWLLLNADLNGLVLGDNIEINRSVTRKAGKPVDVRYSVPMTIKFDLNKLKVRIQSDVGEIVGTLNTQSQYGTGSYVNARVELPGDVVEKLFALERQKAQAKNAPSDSPEELPATA